MTRPNEKCPCGSGKKFKKCCEFKDLQTIPEPPEETPEDSSGEETYEKKKKVATSLFWTMAAPYLAPPYAEQVESILGPKKGFRPKYRGKK